MSIIHFETKLFAIHTWTILKLPQHASIKLPSRGQVMIKGHINGFQFQTALEPDGRGSHWFRVNKDLQKSANIKLGDTVTLAIESTKEWPEPTVPPDVSVALKADERVGALWMDITPLARWEWVRWIGATGRDETRKRRIETAFSKLVAGERRPCCFNRSMSCVPAVSKNGVLLEPTVVSEPEQV
jgi:hypothetical protein